MNKSPLLIAAVAVLGVAAYLVPQAAQAQTVPSVSVTDVTPAGINTGSGMQNAATGNVIQNNGETLIVVKAAASATTATITTQAKTMSQAGYGSAPLSDQIVSVPANSVVFMGPFPTGRWNNQYGHLIVSLSTITAVSISAINVPQ